MNMKVYLNTVDDPFTSEVPFPLSQPPKRSPSTTMLCVIPSVRGDEPVEPERLEDETVVMSREQLDHLLCLDGHPTVRSMRLTPPSENQVVEVKP